MVHVDVLSQILVIEEFSFLVLLLSIPTLICGISWVFVFVTLFYRLFSLFFVNESISLCVMTSNTFVPTSYIIYSYVGDF